jgi:hypothetical protein
LSNCRAGIVAIATTGTVRTAAMITRMRSAAVGSGSFDALAASEPDDAGTCGRLAV